MVSEVCGRPGRIPGGYIRFVHGQDGLRRIVAAHSQHLPAQAGTGVVDRAGFHRTIEVPMGESTLNTPLHGRKQVSIEISFARAARTALTAEKYVGGYYASGETGFTRIGRSQLLEKVRANMQIELAGEKLPFPPIMWDHLNIYLLPFLPEELKGQTGPGELVRLFAPSRLKIEELLAEPTAAAQPTEIDLGSVSSEIDLGGRK